ncbi:MAG: hypothetical protein H0T50_12105 [Gemmatimonadales bacterium]|nr:hypothetical protein [Gemmatimonadales bacterium]
MHAIDGQEAVSRDHGRENDKHQRAETHHNLDDAPLRAWVGKAGQVRL